MKVFAWIRALALAVFALEEFFLVDVLLGQTFPQLQKAPFSYVVPALLFSAICMGFPLVWLLLKNKFNEKPWAFVVYALALFFGISALRIGATFFDEKLGVEKFDYRIGNCNKNLGFVMRSSLGQKTVKGIVGSFNPLAQYAYYVAEDFCRARKIAVAFNSTHPPICRDSKTPNDSFECFKEFLIMTSPHSKVGSFVHTDTAAKMLGIKASDSTELRLASQSMVEKAMNAAKFAAFAMHMIQLQKQPGSPEKIIENISQQDKEKYLWMTQKLLSMANSSGDFKGPASFALPSDTLEAPAVEE